MYLYPLDAAASSAYIRWEYKVLDKQLAYMFYRQPPAAFIHSLHKSLDKRTSVAMKKALTSARSLLPHELWASFDHRVKTDSSFANIVEDISYSMTKAEKKATLEVFVRR